MSKWSARHGGQLDDESMHENNIMNGDKFCIFMKISNFKLFYVMKIDGKRWCD